MLNPACIDGIKTYSEEDPIWREYRNWLDTNPLMNWNAFATAYNLGYKAKENEMEKEKEPCEKIPLYEFEAEVTLLLASYRLDLDDCVITSVALRDQYVAKISEAAVRLLLNGDK